MGLINNVELHGFSAGVSSHSWIGSTRLQLWRGRQDAFFKDAFFFSSTLTGIELLTQAQEPMVLGTNNVPFPTEEDGSTATEKDGPRA